MRIRSVPAALFVFATGALAGVAAAEEVHRDFHETFPVTQGMKLTLVHGDGQVLVSSWDQDSLDVEVRYRAEFTRVGVGPAMDFTVVTDNDDRGVRVTGKESSLDGFFVGIHSSRYVEYVYRIRAPRWLALDFEGEDGDVLVEGWRSSVALRLEDGDVTLEDLEGDLEIHGEDGEVRITDSRIAKGRIDVEDGDVRILKSSGDFTISTEDGSVDLGNVPAGPFDVRTEDGDVEVDLGPGKHLDLRVETEDGSVRVALAKGISAAYMLRTQDGGITLDLPGDHREEDEEAVGRLGDGDGTLVVRTDGGRIILRQDR